MEMPNDREEEAKAKQAQAWTFLASIKSDLKRIAEHGPQDNRDHQIIKAALSVILGDLAMMGV